LLAFKRAHPGLPLPPTPDGSCYAHDGAAPDYSELGWRSAALVAMHSCR
jgi:hypothetical protein